MKKNTFLYIVLGVFCLFFLQASQGKASFSQQNIKKKPTVKKETIKKEKVFLPRPKQINLKGNLENVEEESTTATFLKSVFILLIFLALAYIILKWIQRKKQALTQADKDGVISVLKTTSITNNKSIQLVEIGNKIYILGLGDQNISLISTVENQSEVGHLKDLCQNSESRKKTFAEILSSNFSFAPKSLAKKTSGALGNSLQFFNEQRDKLKELKNKF